jgi:hypothetical protein
MTLPAIRPEDRRREAAPLPCDDALLWAACRRSEGFAEDLPAPVWPAAPRPAGPWRGAGLAPVWGVALAAVLGVLAR